MSEEEDDFGRRTRQLDARGRRELLDDLESIRSLLGDDDGAGDSADGVDLDAVADAIPVLHEIVRSSPPEPATDGDRDPVAAPRAEEQQGDLFDPRVFADRLLDADWAEERERILADARAGVDAFSLGLDEASRREREARLREAVAARLAPRMEQLLGEALDELRDDMLRVIRRELDTLLNDVFGDADGGPTRPGAPDEHQD